MTDDTAISILTALNKLTAAVESLRDARVGLVELHVGYRDEPLLIPAKEITRIESCGESYRIFVRRYDGMPDSFYTVSNGPAVIERMNALGGVKVTS